MKHTLLAIALLGCDQGRTSPPISFDQFVPKLAATAPPPRVDPPPFASPPQTHVRRPRVAIEPQPRDPNALPEPPTVEPKAYAVWLASQSAGDRQRIAKLCRKHPVDFETACGGIGPLHIPYPPYPRVKMPGPDDLQSLFTEVDAWQAALSPAQKKYIERNCAGGEMRPTSDLCGDNTPLVVAFDDQPVQFTTTAGTFAFAGADVATDWPTAVTPWIALDRDGDGAITTGAELFGSGTMLADGTHASNGFIALAALDANHDGRIDAADPAFTQLVLWADANGDRRSSPDELRPLASAIDSISLADHLDARCDARGNCEGERATLRWHDASGSHAGTVVDVYLPSR